jgi:hypothetical protein
MAVPVLPVASESIFKDMMNFMKHLSKGDQSPVKHFSSIPYMVLADLYLSRYPERNI